MKIKDEYWSILRKDEKSNWCLVMEKDARWGMDTGVFFMNESTNQVLSLSFDFEWLERMDYISKDAIMAGLNGFLDAFAKCQPLIQVDDPFIPDNN